MTATDRRAPAAASTLTEAGPPLRPLLTFAGVAVPSGWVLLTVPLVTGLPLPPFVLAVNLLALVLPALILTSREGGRAAVRGLFRDTLRVPAQWWWAPLAMLGLPATVWVLGAALGAARPLTPPLVAGVLLAALSSAVIINLWEELAWTGYFQRRAVARWGAVRGSAVTALLFAGIHLPLALAGTAVLRDVVALLVTGVGLRLLILGIDRWTGSILIVGLLHGSFNATSGLLEGSGDWVRLGVTLLLGIAVAVGLRAARVGRR